MKTTLYLCLSAVCQPRTAHISRGKLSCHHFIDVRVPLHSNYGDLRDISIKPCTRLTIPMNFFYGYRNTRTTPITTPFIPINWISLLCNKYWMNSLVLFMVKGLRKHIIVPITPRSWGKNSHYAWMALNEYTIMSNCSLLQTHALWPGSHYTIKTC